MNLTPRERQELQDIDDHLRAYAGGVKLLFLQGFAAGVGANINKGEKEAIRLGTLAGLAVLRGRDEALVEASPQMQSIYQDEKDRIFGDDKPKVEVVPANVLSKNGKLVHN